MQDKLLKILEIKIAAINRNIENLNYLNDELEKNNDSLSYIQSMIGLFKENDVLNFDSISENDFEKILLMIDPSISDIFKEKTCNYHGIMYIIQGIRQGISLELTSVQTDAILSFVEGMRIKERDLSDVIANLLESRERLPETNLTILSNDLENYKEIVSKIENDLYLTEIDEIVSALDFANVLIEEKALIFEFILKYNASIYSKNKEEQNKENEESLDSLELPTFSYEPVDASFEPINISKIEPKEVVNEDASSAEDILKRNDAVEEDDYETFSFPTINKKDFTSFEPKKEEEVEKKEEVNGFLNSNQEPIEINEEKLEDSLSSVQTNTVDLQEIIAKIDAKLKEMEQDESNKKVEETKEDSLTFSPFSNSILENDEEGFMEDNETSLNEILTKYGIKESLNLTAKEVNPLELDSLLGILSQNKMLDLLKTKENILSSILLNRKEKELLDLLELIKENLSVNPENYQNVLEIMMETMPILFTSFEVIDSFKKNIEFFKEHQINLINLFDNYRELLIMNHSDLKGNYLMVEKYGLSLNNDNVKYFLYNKNLLKNLDYYIEAMGKEKGFLGKEDIFDGVEYIQKHPYKLNGIEKDVLLKLRFQTENNQKIYGSKPGILAGEIANPKVDLLTLPKEYKETYFQNEYEFIDQMELENLLKEIKENTDFDVTVDDTILAFDEKYQEGNLRYKINNVLYSRIKTIRIYNFLKQKGFDGKNALLLALTYNSVIKKEEYHELVNIINGLVMGGN